MLCYVRIKLHVVAECRRGSDRNSAVDSQAMKGAAAGAKRKDTARPVDLAAFSLRKRSLAEQVELYQLPTGCFLSDQLMYFAIN